MRRQRGVALVFVLGGVLAVGLLAGTFSGAVLNENRFDRMSRTGLQAFWAAESGVDRALVSLRDSDFLSQVSDSGGPEISYAVLGPGGYEADIQPVPGQAGLYRVVAIGSSSTPGSGAPDFQQRRVDAVVRVMPGVPLPKGLFANTSVYLNGSFRVDSYDSRTGGVVSTNAGAIGTNGTAAKSIDLIGSADIFGNVVAGPGAPDSAISLKGAVRVSGDVGNLEEPVPMEPVAGPAGTEDLVVSGGETVTLSGGVHRFRMLSIGSSSTLEFTGPAIVYVEDFELDGGALVTSGNLPENLAIQVVGDEAIEWESNGTFYGILYAPESQISLSGNSTFYGAVAADRISGGGSGIFWYDEALEFSGGKTGFGQATTEMVFWQEMR